MGRTISSKMITVRSRGNVTTSRGRFMAPIRTPYLESTDRIWSMITQDRADVWERLSNGTDVQLNAQNFDQDNNAPKKVVVTEEKNEEPEKEEGKQEEPKQEGASNENTETVTPANENTEAGQPDTDATAAPANAENVVPEAKAEEKADATNAAKSSKGKGKNSKKNATSEEKKAESAALEVNVEEA